jgi:CheY-like chemotaxis protein
MSAKVMVIDDDDDIREATIGLLEAEGFRTCEANSGEMALEKVAEDYNVPCVILLDWSMPGISGDALLAKMSTHHVLASLPVVIYTGDDLKHPGHKVVRKGVAVDTLLQVVKEYCHKLEASCP